MEVTQKNKEIFFISGTTRYLKAHYNARSNIKFHRYPKNKLPNYKIILIFDVSIYTKGNMFHFNDIEFKNLIVHRIGSKPEDEGINLSGKCIDLEEEQLQLLMMNYLLQPFKSGEHFHLTHPEGLENNEVYNCVSQMFDDPESFIEQSVNLANHLYDQSTHPKIKTGEFYVAHLENCFFDGEMVDAIGLFKSESKETFIKVKNVKGSFFIESEDGINVNKLDKGCIIFNVEKENGYVLSIVDSVNKNAEARYWRDDFLKITPRKDDYHQTRNYLEMCKTFVVEQAPKEFEISKADQADFLNNSASYFKKNEDFDFDEFSQQVIKQPEVTESFKTYKKQYEAEHACQMDDSFAISAPAVKKEAKIFKSVIKLDKNFHIYVHGNREYIVKGFDEKTGMHYYQLFYKEESN